MSLPKDYFDDLYAASPDPWSLASRWYETRKYAVTLASLPRPRYRRGFEAGCSIGVLTELLADRCDALLAVDIAGSAVEATRLRVARHLHVEAQQLAIPGEWPDGSFDLIVLSEVGYYLDSGTLGDLMGKAVTSLAPDGTLVAVHWRHPVADYPLGGDEVHAALRASDRLAVLAHHEEQDFQLDVMVPQPLVSVAAASGLVSP
jgi:SAM-dependent methyltransferase